MMTQSKPCASSQTAPASSASAYHAISVEDDENADIDPIARQVDDLTNSEKDITIHDQSQLLKVQGNRPLLTGKIRRNVRQTFEFATNDYWTYELIGVFVCVGSLTSIIAVLFAFNGKPTPQIMGSITLNTAISLLATFSRASAALIASSVIAQQKWLRFERKSRSLIEMLLYDDATRGPLGSLYLLGTLRMSLITASAAMVTVLALGFESFIQQSVKYPSRDLPILVVPIPSLSIVQNTTLGGHPLYPTLNSTLAIDSAISQALYADVARPVQPDCGAAICEWPSYESVAYCALCEDAMRDVAIEPKLDPALQELARDDYVNTFNFMNLGETYFDSGPLWSMSLSRNTAYSISLGQGYPMRFNLTTKINLGIGAPLYERILAYPSTIVWDMSIDMNQTLGDGLNHLGSAWRDSIINGVKGPLKALGFVNLTLSPSKEQLVATSAERCIISLCAQKYSSSFRNGSLNLNVTERSWGSIVDLDAGRGNVTGWAATLGKSQFRAGDIVNQDVIWVFREELQRLEGAVETRVTGMRPNTEPDSRPDFEYTWSAGTDTMHFMSDMQNSSARIAQSLTNLIQMHGDGYASGLAYENKPVVEVRWAWLTFPVALVFLVLGALIATMVQTKNEHVPVWKFSPFPLLFNYDRHGGHEDLTDKDESAAFVPQAVTTSRHNEIAEDTYLRLRSTAGSWILTEKSPPIVKTREPFLPVWITGLFRWRSKHHTV